MPRTEGRTLMIQGASSHAGKSLLVTALCRIFHQDGWRVAPFKAQNMSLNAAVTADGAEIARSQAVQALAAGVEPEAAMNPFLLKPKGDFTSQVIVLGRPRGDYTWQAYRHELRDEALAVIAAALDDLRARYDIVVLEGAGSPAEINLMDRDLANMTAAELADAPVLLVGDIDRGGVFASLLGTYEILPPAQRRRLKGWIINKFRGERGLLEPALRWLTERTGVPVLGVIPYLSDPGLDEEDSVALEPPERRRNDPSRQAEGEATEPVLLELAVVRLPRISNFTDFTALAREPGVRVRYIDKPSQLSRPDAVILPGTKNTVEDLIWMYRSGLAAAIQQLAARGLPVVGICGGFQMLGQSLRDPDRVESKLDPPPGLGLLPVTTTFRPQKHTRRVRARWVAPPSAAPWAVVLPPEPIAAYEIHAGVVEAREDAVAAFQLDDGRLEGVVAADGLIWGSHLHGVFDAAPLRRAWLNLLRARRGWPPLPLADDNRPAALEQAFNRLANHVRQHLDLAAVYGLLGLEPRSRVER